MNKSFLLCLLGISMITFSCKDEPVEPPVPPSTAAVLIAHEGVFPSGVGSITTYNPETKEVINNAFQKANTYPAGPVINSLMVDGDRTFIVVNGSGSVYVVNTHTLQVETKFENLDSPRHVIKVGEDKYFISDWGINGVHVVNMKTKTINKTLETGNGPERMLLVDDMVFITNSGGFNAGATQEDSTVIVYHAQADTVIDTLYVGENPNSLAMDKNGFLWVLSPGITDFNDPSLSSNGMMHKINIDSMWVDTAFTFLDNQLKPAELVADGNGEFLYFLENDYSGGVMRFHVDQVTLPVMPYISGGFYSLGYDVINDEIYTGNANDFVSAGTIKRYDSDGTEVHSFRSGIIPGSFGFK